jgi:hypothetical protein
MKKIVWEWEQIDEITSRVKVMGGWFICKRLSNSKGVISESIVFLPDQDWQWQPCAPFVDPQIEKANIAKDFKAL